MSAIEFDNLTSRPALAARIATWATGFGRAHREAPQRPQRAPSSRPVRPMVGACAPAGGARVGRDPWRRLASSCGSEPAGGCAAASACSLARRLETEQLRSRRAEEALSHYLAPQVLDRLMANPEGPSLGGETHDVTVLFADIRGFSALAEALEDDPQRLVRLTEAVLGPLTDIVLEHGGTLDKYMGDCVMAFWGAPDRDPEHPRRAFEAARAMLAAMEGIVEQVRAEFAGEVDLGSLSLGVGINSGRCVVGNVGSQRRFDYSVLGDPVNVASRLQELCKTYGRPLIVGEATARRLDDDCGLEALDRIVLRGRRAPQSVYALA